MGCVSSKHDINDQHPNIFQVTNVNEQGELISPGQLEVTENELILHQRAKSPTVWPLRSLRKYGFDSEIFSFECGRRSPTGEGIYAFRCRKAEQLFNIVHQHIARNSSNVQMDDGTPHDPPAAPPLIQRRIDPYLAPTAVRQHPVLSRPGSIASSNGPISPIVSPPPLPAPALADIERNNNKRANDHPAYVNTEDVNYANITSPTLTDISPCHLYMNIETTPDDDMRHCYANIDSKEIDMLRPIYRGEVSSSSSVPATPTSLLQDIREVNYAELDLDRSDDDRQEKITTQQISDETDLNGDGLKKGYATIDFQKTNALSQSINSRMEDEECNNRKIRHNSTVMGMDGTITTSTTRHSNSLSD